MTGYTYNASDNVFSDGTSNEMSTVTGSLSAGYILTHTIYVAGAVLEHRKQQTPKILSGTELSKSFPRRNYFPDYS
jgi:hypothetical protein